MMRSTPTSWRSLLLAGAPLLALAGEPGPHQHGVARLEVAVDGAVLSLFLESPLNNLLGFEHYPRTAQQQAAVRALGARLRMADAVFVPTPGAGCTVSSVKLESQAFEAKPPAHKRAHSDLEATYVFRCAFPDRLRGVEVRLFDVSPGMRRIDARVAGPRGQAGARLDPAHRSLRW